jgi:23S rRNA (adenine1618-N6)-methyltransferase
MKEEQDSNTEKISLHPRNRHRNRYDFKTLLGVSPELRNFVKPNIYGDDTIDFFDPEAVKALNRALLKSYYNLDYWDIPEGYLCPPIPGRADYIHNAADILAKSFGNKIPNGKSVKCLDIGTGANCIYPIIGNKEYGWHFIGSDIDPVAITSAEKIISENPDLEGQIELRLQKNPRNIFQDIIQEGEQFELTICNPPFHASAKEARNAAIKKLKNLRQKNITKPKLNFGGKQNELWTEGGEENFVKSMIQESKDFDHSCLWFTALISKETNLKSAYHHLKKAEAAKILTLPMAQGNKISRIIAWSFLSEEKHQEWSTDKKS